MYAAKQVPKSWRVRRSPRSLRNAGSFTSGRTKCIPDSAHGARAHSMPSLNWCDAEMSLFYFVVEEVCKQPWLPASIILSFALSVARSIAQFTVLSFVSSVHASVRSRCFLPLSVVV